MKTPTESNANEAIIPNLLAPYWQQVREKLCPELEKELSVSLTTGLRRVAQILEIVRIEEHVDAPKMGGRGRRLLDRRPLARAFLAKSILNLTDTRLLIDQLKQSPALRQLCGMTQVPSEATFSRAFSWFASQNVADFAHEALVKKFVSDPIVLHVSHDSTAVEAREKAVVKVKPVMPKKSGGVLGRAKSIPTRSLLESNGRWKWNRTPPSQNFRVVVIGESSAIRTDIRIVGEVIKPIYPGRMGWFLCFV